MPAAHLVSGPIDLKRCVRVTLEKRRVLVDTRMKTVLAPQLPAVLTIQERSEKEEQTYHDRENLHWDRDVRVEARWVSICCSGAERVIGRLLLGCIILILHYLKNQPNNQTTPTPPKINSRKLIKRMDFDFEQVSSSFLKLVYIRNKLAYVYPCGQFPGIPLRNFAGYDSPSWFTNCIVVLPDTEMALLRMIF